MAFNRDLEEVKYQEGHYMGRGKSGAKALRQDCAWRVSECEGGPAGWNVVMAGELCKR